MRTLYRIITSLALLPLLALTVLPLSAVASEDPNVINPLRVSYIDGGVSFWRYGADDWVEAQINTPLATGDALYVASDGVLELQSGSRAFIRANGDSNIALINQTADFLQLKVTSGHVSFDLRSLPAPGYSIELDTPNAVFMIDHIGYYRVDVNDEVHFITRRGGRAAMTPAGGEAMNILPSEEIVVRGTDIAQAEMALEFQRGIAFVRVLRRP